MAADKTLKLEVQGHTDNVGNDASNQTLSEARAKTVVTWLTQHSVAADRLTAKGYGKTKPVADNGSDEGRGIIAGWRSPIQLLAERQLEPARESDSSRFRRAPLYPSTPYR